MFETIFLLSGEVELPVLSAVLMELNPALTVVQVKSLAEMPSELAVLATARLVAFLFPELVPTSMLSAVGFGAYNFHSGSPAYPGWQPVAFATYDGVREYGALLHEMAAKADSGPINDVEMFPVPPGASRALLAELTYLASLRLFQRNARALACAAGPLPRCGAQWSGEASTRRKFREMARCPADASPEEVRRRDRAFGAGDGTVEVTAIPGL